MTPTDPKSSQPWDSALYDGRHAFVWKHGTSLIELLAPQPGERILDLGCGTGHLTALIAQAGTQAVGLDHSPEMLEQARAAYSALTFVQGDARDFAFAEPFHAVFSNAVLHWIKQPADVLRCVRQCLLPGGRFVAELGGRGNVRTIETALRTAAGRAGVPFKEPLWFFPSVGEYGTLLEAAGLEVTFAALFDRLTPLEGKQGLRDWVRMFARSLFDAVPEERREAFLQTVEELVRPELCRDGSWVADYRRLRVVAVAI